MREPKPEDTEQADFARRAVLYLVDNGFTPAGARQAVTQELEMHPEELRLETA